MKKIIALLILVLTVTNSKAQIKNEIFQFEFEGDTLNGIYNIPENGQPKGIVLITQGAGQTNVVAEEWYYDVRETMIGSGYATYMWDKKGCGKSGGTFNYNQSVQNSALEVIAAINALQKRQIPGSENIGLWGISRAGWINPLVINQYKGIRFWISVSGVDDKENFKYLLEENLKIAGLSKKMIDTLANEWVAGSRISHSGGSFEQYQAATTNLQRNEFWLRFTNGAISEEGYYSYQQTFMKETLDEETGLQLYIKDFEAILSNVNCPVLALFGEKDMNVDWTKTKALYEKAMTRHADLTIRSFPDCNHNLFQCKTGGFYEIQDNKLPRTRCEGFLDAMKNWLGEKR